MADEETVALIRDLSRDVEYYRKETKAWQEKYAELFRYTQRLALICENALNALDLLKETAKPDAIRVSENLERRIRDSLTINELKWKKAPG